MTKHIGILNLGISFLSAANALKDGSQYWPTYYLYGHAIELGLKSFLHYKGMTDKELRKIGHNLTEAWSKCSDLGLLELICDYQQFQECIFIMNDQYMEKGLEYHNNGNKRLPDFNQLNDAVQNVICSLDAYYRGDLAQKNNDM